ncbi:MAG: PAS domain S-box protein [Opitutaceae bacterium]
MKRPAASALRLAGGYVLIGALWILLSGPASEALPSRAAQARLWQIGLGGLFIATSGALLFVFARRQFEARARLEVERLAERDRFQALLHERTSLRQTETVATESERIFRAIFEHAAIGIAQVGTDGRMLRVNEHFCSLLGRPERELQNFTFVDITHPDDIEADVSLVARCLAGEIERYSIEKRYLRPDGRAVWVNLFVALVRDGNGQPAYFVSVATDINWRKTVEEALADSRQRLQSAIEIARLGFWEFNVETRTMYYSHEAIAQLGMNDGEVSNSPDEYRSRVHPDDRPRLEAMRQSLLFGTEETAEGEFRFQHKDGSFRDIHVRTVLLRGPDGKRARLLGTNIDVTPARDSERLIRRLSARILRLQDTERRRIARQLHETTAQNLAALNMNLARLGRMSARPDHDPRETVDECIHLTDTCVQEIRTLAYLLHPPLLDDFGLERATLDYVQGFSQRSGVATEARVEGRIERLPDEIELILFRILQESLTNVVRHSACSQARVELRQTGEAIELEISDNGRGIPPENLERLRAGAPLGVGVTGMSERLEQIGGRLEINSSHAGTTVRAVVPIQNRDEETPASQDCQGEPVRD